MNHIIEILETSFLIYFINTYFFSEFKKHYIYLFPFLSILITLLIVIFSYNNILIFVVYLIIYFIIPILATKNSIWNSIYISFLSIGIISFTNSFIMFVVYFLIPKEYTTYFTLLVSSCILLAFIIISTISNSIVKKICNFLNISLSIRILFLLIIWLFLILITIENTAFIYQPNTTFNIYISFSTILLLIGSIILFFRFIVNDIKKRHYEKISHILEMNIQSQTKYYEQKYLTYSKLRSFKHDYDNIKIGLYNLLTSGKTDDAINFLNCIDNSLKTNYSLISTGNPIVDAILSDKQNDIIQNNIKIIFSGNIPYDCIETIDLCVVLGNSLDNAIEACLILPSQVKKIINIEAKKNKQLLIITLSNPVSHKVDIVNNSVSSTKEDPLSHGIGLYSINNTVNKYNGFYEVSCDETHFTLTMGFMLKNN